MQVTLQMLHFQGVRRDRNALSASASASVTAAGSQPGEGVVAADWLLKGKRALEVVCGTHRGKHVSPGFNRDAAVAGNVCRRARLSCSLEGKC